jgi:signal transduction histidine kinase
MLRRLQQLKMPLAAKCQLLFGIAALLIIAAALVVPWQRMEQLTEQLNESAAKALVEIELSKHVEAHVAAPVRPTPTTRRATTQPLLTLTDGSKLRRTELLSIDRLTANAETFRFESAALARFERRPQTPFFARLISEGETQRYRFAAPLRTTGVCLDCHGSVRLPTTVASASVGDAPTTVPDTPPLLGVISVEIPSQISTRQLLLNRVFMLLAGLFAGSLAIVILYVIITRLILKPVRVLQETAEKVSAGDLNIRSHIASGDEFQQLSETLNTMLRNLGESAEQLKAMNKSLDQRLGQLAEANLALFESNRLKSEFLASVSHELRTPLNSILGFAELLRDLLQSGDAKAQRYVGNIMRSGKHLLDLINDLLDLAKIEAGRMEIRAEPISLPDLFEVLAALLRPLYEAKGIWLQTMVSPSVPIIVTDPAKLQQILYNFLSNAIRFSPENQPIELQARLDPGERVRISVRDRGPGVPTDKQEVIFEKFRQLDQSMTREHGGTGLGLAIARELATLLRGSVGVESKPGDGAEFWVSVPIQIESRTQDLRGKTPVNA